MYHVLVRLPAGHAAPSIQGSCAFLQPSVQTTSGVLNFRLTQEHGCIVKQVAHWDRFVLSGATDASFLVHDALNPDLKLIAALDTSNGAAVTSTATRTDAADSTGVLVTAVASNPTPTASRAHGQEQVTGSDSQHADETLGGLPSREQRWDWGYKWGSAIRKVKRATQFKDGLKPPDRGPDDVPKAEMSALRPGLRSSTTLARQRRTKMVFLETFGSFVVGGIAPDDLEVLSHGQVLDSEIFRNFVQAGMPHRVRNPPWPPPETRCSRFDELAPHAPLDTLFSMLIEYF